MKSQSLIQTLFGKYLSQSISFLAVVLLMGCSPGERTNNPEHWPAEKISEWFTEMDWQGQNEFQPDPSIDKKDFAVRYHRHSDRWDKAFAFLKDANLSDLEVGIHELYGAKVFAIVTEYVTSNPEDVRHEAHKLYSDIHYVVSGKEYIALSEMSDATLKIPYDEERDIAFYHIENGRNLLAEPGTFFIFPPGTVHGPGMRVDENIPVKKVVVKVRD